MQFDDLFVSLDVGSSKVVATVCGEVEGDDRLHVLASLIGSERWPPARS